MRQRKIIFVDRDGTLVEEPPDEQVDGLDKIRLLPNVMPAMLALKGAGFDFVMVSNQDGLGTAIFPRERFELAQNFILQLFASQGVEFEAVCICPHTPSDACDCRKPKLGAVRDFLTNNTLDKANSYMIGDRDTDLQFAAALGVTGLRVELAGTAAETWPAIAAHILGRLRGATVRRKTKETDIAVTVDLAADGPIEVATGIAFFDHMLQQIAKHGGFALQLTCRGDLEVDEHHTVEDCALALGAALREALGDKRGIGRYGFLLPMDESLAQVALDLSGRPYFVWQGQFGRESVGGLPTELVPHFFRSLAESLGAALHVSVAGENAHHMVESCFKAVGRSLRQAIRVDGMELPSTKGTL